MFLPPQIQCGKDTEIITNKCGIFLVVLETVVKLFEILTTINFNGSQLPKMNFKVGGRTRLPKSKFLANFPIGLHMILQIQIK